MAKIIEKLFGSEESASELQQLHGELRIAIDNLRKLEQDWREKVKIVREFLSQWNNKWDLNKLNESIRILKKVDDVQITEMGVFGKSVLHIEHIVTNTEIPKEIRDRVMEIFSKEEETWKALKLCAQRQLDFVERYMNRDIGLVRFHINYLINALKKEGQLLGLEKREFNLILKVEGSLELKIRGRLIRGLNYNRRLARLYSLGFPKHHNEELANFLVWEWQKTERIIRESGQHSEYVLSKGIPAFYRHLSRDNLLDIGIATARLANAFGDKESEKIISRTTHPYVVARIDIYLEVADIVIDSRHNHACVIEAIGVMREMITKENIVKIGKSLVQIADASGENAEPVLETGIVYFKFLITPESLLDVGLCLTELVKNG